MAPIETTGASRNRRGWEVLRFGLPGLVLGAALAWAFGLSGPSLVRAQPTPNPMASPVMVTTVESAGDPGSTRLILVDQRTQALAVYKIDGFKGGSIKLEAARQFGADLKLSEYNNLPPEVASVEAMVAGPRSSGTSRQ